MTSRPFLNRSSEHISTLENFVKAMGWSEQMKRNSAAIARAQETPQLSKRLSAESLLTPICILTTTR